MKVIRLLTSDFGGAALCVTRLHDAMISLGVEEKILVADKHTNNPDIVQCDADVLWSENLIFRKLQILLRRIHLWPCKEMFDYQMYRIIDKTKILCYSSPFSYYKSLPKLKELNDADIINLHWVANFVDIPSFFKDVKQPIVWSLHDENPLRGGLHYPNNDHSIEAIENRIIEIKKKAYQHVSNLHIVVQSRYMQRQCLSSELLSRFPIYVIPNGVNVRQFVMHSKAEARKRLGLRRGKIVFLFVSVILEEPRKGLKELISALESLGRDDIELLCIGRYSSKPKASFAIDCLGYVSNDEQFSLAYSAADYFVLPSFYESFAKTPLEAMACGTPVIAFPCSGTEDCITKETGVICKDFSVESLRQGINDAFRIDYHPEVLRKYVEDNFSFKLMSERYAALYREILAYCGK